MTYYNGQLENFNLTTKETEKVIDEIRESYISAYSEVDKELAKTYAKILEGVNPEDYFNEMIKFKRLDSLQKNISQIMIDTFNESNRSTLEAEKLAMSNSYYRNIYQYQWFSNLSFIPLDNDLLNYAATGNQSTWNDIAKNIKDMIDRKNYTPATGTLSELLKDNNIDALSKVRKAVNNGFIQGKSYKDFSKDIEKLLLGDKGDGTKGLSYNALRIARTEGGRTLSLGQLHSNEQAVANGVEIMKMWDATLDTRTRQSHGAADGQTVPVNESFTVQGESLPAPRVNGSQGNVINCRCAMVNIIDGVKPELRRGRNPVTGKTEVFEYKDFNQWAKENGLKYNKSGRLV